MGIEPFALEGLYSPAGLGARVFAQMGVRAPLAKFHLGDDELAAWTRCLRGGWVTDGPLDGRPFPVLDADVHSAYPAIWSLTGGWDHLCAERLRPVDVTKSFARFLARDDLDQLMLDPATWRRWSLTRVRLRASGQPFAVSVVHKGDDAMLVVPTRAESWDATWLDGVAAHLLGEVPVEVISAVRLAPRGRQKGLSAVRYPGGLLDPDHDPIIELVHLRARAKARGDVRSARQLRVMCNGMVYGNFLRFDSIGTGREKPGPWCFPPMAAVMAAGSRCLLAMVEARVRNIGGVIAQRDTDGVLIVAAPEGGF